MAEQLVFDLPAHVSLAEGDFFVSDANRAAWEMLDSPGRWPQGKLLVVGPLGSGKTHLARIFAARTGARVAAAADLDPKAADLPRVPMVIEDADGLPSAAQERLFHLHNHLVAQGLPLLLTAAVPPADWGLTLPDLASRMQATTLLRIAEPDDPLLMALLMKHFSDRQLRPSPAVLAFLCDRIERSFEGARRIVEQIDAAALQDGREITLPLARAVLDMGAAKGE